MKRKLLPNYVIGTITVLLFVCLSFNSMWIMSWYPTESEHQQTVPDPEPDQDSEVKYGGIWMEYLGFTPVTKDPAQATSVEESRLAALIYSRLTRLTPEGTIEGDLARNWEVKNDGLKYRFHLRREVTFSNGQPLNADDVIFSFLRLLSPDTDSPRAWVLKDVLGAEQYNSGKSNEVAGFQAEDPYTITITLNRPRSSFLSLLAMPAASIVSRRVAMIGQQDTTVEAPGGKTGFQPIGSGPVVLTDFFDGEYIELDARDDYHLGRPYLDGIRYELDKSRQQVKEMFEKGRLSVINIPAELKEKYGSANFQIMTAEKPAVYYLGFNNQNPPLSDAKVRKAINYAIPKGQLLESVIPGGFSPAAGAIPPQLPGHNTDLTGYPYDQQKAKQILREFGYSNGLELRLLRGGSARAQQITDKIADYLSEVGINVNIATLETNELFEMLDTSEDYDMFYLSWWADFPDPESFLYPLFHSDNLGGAGNRTEFSCSEVDVILDAARKIAHRSTERFQLYQQAEQIISKQAPWVPLYYPVRHQSVQSFVKGYRAGGTYLMTDMTEVWYDDTP